jgi:hypothetical protein
VSCEAFSLLLQDASIILRPRAVTEVKAAMDGDGSGNIIPESHPNGTALLVLSDLAKLYGHGNADYERSAQRRREVAINRKLGFYAARFLCVPTMTLRVLADEVQARSKLFALESNGNEQPERIVSPSTSRIRSKIEEL